MTDLQKLCNANVLPKKITLPKPTPQSAYDVERMLEELNTCEDCDDDCEECSYYEESEEYNPCANQDYCEDCPYWDDEDFCSYDY